MSDRLPTIPQTGTRTVTAFTATTIAIADMVGTGVFTSLGFQVLGIQSGFSLLMLWIVGGAVALCGALAYAELATAFPRSGGEYNFLSRTYHPAVGFMAGWVSATVGFAAPIAAAAIALGKYFEGVFPGLKAVAEPVGAVSGFGSLFPANAISLLMALAVVWFVSLIHLRGIREGSWFHNGATAIKLALIVTLIVAGFAIGTPQAISFAPVSGDFATITGGTFAFSLVYVMFSYSGWNAATYIAGEVRDPGRNLPRSIFWALFIVITLYVLLNAVFLYVTPMSSLAGQIDVALVAGQAIFGDIGGRIVGALICIGLVSTISAMTWIGPRVTMVMGEDIPLFRFLSVKNRHGAPTVAILLQLAIVTVLLLTQSFEAIIDYIQFSLTFCSFLAVLGVIVLRFTQPDLPRPYRVWAYPLTPVIFLVVTLFIMRQLILKTPYQSLAGLLTMAAGLLIYLLSTRFRRESAIQGNS